MDEENTVVSAFSGKPYGLTPRQSREWDEQSRAYAIKMEELRLRHETSLPQKVTGHGRGDFTAITWGIGYGNGMTVPANFLQKTKSEKCVVESLNSDAYLCDLANRASGECPMLFN